MQFVKYNPLAFFAKAAGDGAAGDVIREERQQVTSISVSYRIESNSGNTSQTFIPSDILVL